MGFWADHIRRHCEKPDVIVNGEGEAYLKRYTLMHQPDLRVYLHQILLSDDDRALHDHPWDFKTILLSGGYYEEIPAGWNNLRRSAHGALVGTMETKKIFHPRFSVIRHKAEDLHRIDLPDGKPVWTLFIAGNKSREWGFMSPKGWVHWREYINEKFGPSSVEADMATKEMGE